MKKKQKPTFAKDFLAGERIRWPGDFVSLVHVSTAVDFGHVIIHEWEPSVGGLSRIVLPPELPLERVEA